MYYSYKVRQVKDLTELELALINEKFEGQTGKYLVGDQDSNFYGRYDKYEDAEDHVETLNHMED